MSNIDKDAITAEATLENDVDGGQRYRIGILNLVVLNGTHAEMGRQYGTLMKDELHATRDIWKKLFVDSGKVEYESFLEVIGRPFYTSAPKVLKDLYNGVAEASGMNIHDVVILDNWLPIVLTGRRAACTSMVAWGSKTKDGTSYMGRNFDFPAFLQDMFASSGVITVMNPNGGEFGVAGIGVPGVITGYDDAINSRGLYFEFNNGAGSVGPVLYSNRYVLPTFMRNTLLSYSTIDELRMVFNSSKPDYPAIVGVCQPDRGIHFEVSPETYVAVDAGTETSARANQFVNPEWGIPPLPGKAAWYSNTRQELFEKLINEKAPNIDETAFMDAMNAPLFNPDGSLSNSGFSVLEGLEGDAAAAFNGEVTVYQIITHSSELKWWVRIPTHSGWMEIDFKKYFRN